MASFLMSILSGISGGGGGFVTTPLAIFLGLTPQQAIATGKIGGLGTTIGSLEGFQKEKIARWRIVLPLIILATIIGLTAPLIIKNLDNDIYRRLMGAALLALTPVIWFRKIGYAAHKPAPWVKFLAGPALVVAMLMQAIFSTGMGALVMLVLMGMMGMKALEANVSKRFSQVVLNVLIVLGLLSSGLIVWKVAIVLLIGNTLGGYMGSKIAIEKGNKFVTKVFVVLMTVSGIGLLLG